MNLSAPFIQRPVATTLLTIGVALVGRCRLSFAAGVASAAGGISRRSRSRPTCPGASPETMATSVAAPLERQFGRIAGVTEMTSTSYLGSTSIVPAVRLEPRISTARRATCRPPSMRRAGNLPTNLPSNPTYRKVNPADAPILILALTSDTSSRGRCTTPRRDSAAEALAGGGRRPGDRGRRLAAGRARRSEPDGAEQVRHRTGRRPRRR